MEIIKRCTKKEASIEDDIEEASVVFLWMERKHVFSMVRMI